jgi:DNA processing protein
MMTEKQLLVSICTFEGFGPVRVKLLLKYFGSARKIWLAKAEELIKIGLKKDLVSKFEEHRQNFDAPGYFKKLDDLSVQTISIFDKNYPKNLKGLDDAPVILYVKGDLQKGDIRAVAVIGSRAMTSYGREIAGQFATQLANFGITVVSGLALGIDAAAQKAALAAGGRTIAVLASGLDIISPAANKALALEFIKKNGAIVSEYPLGHMPFPSDFAIRNRLISGLSKAVIVIEASMKSGTFYTVKAALDQGRPVFAVPGQINSLSSAGTNYLIQNGAKLTTSVRDVMDELNLQMMVNPKEVEKAMPADASEEKIYRFLETEPLHLDELVRISGLETSEISARLTIMEMKGLVRNTGNGIYKKT